MIVEVKKKWRRGSRAGQRLGRVLAAHVSLTFIPDSCWGPASAGIRRSGKEKESFPDEKPRAGGYPPRLPSPASGVFPR
jgi:hypothetical protein